VTAVKDSAVAGANIGIRKAGEPLEAGVELWKRSSARTIYTNCNIDSNGDNANDTAACLSTSGLMKFFTANRSGLRRYLQLLMIMEAEAITRYVQARTIRLLAVNLFIQTKDCEVDLNNDGDTADTVGGIAEGHRESMETR